jgi:hypothetical protein
VNSVGDTTDVHGLLAERDRHDGVEALAGDGHERVAHGRASGRCHRHRASDPASSSVAAALESSSSAACDAVSCLGRRRLVALQSEGTAAADTGAAADERQSRHQDSRVHRSVRDAHRPSLTRALPLEGAELRAIPSIDANRAPRDHRREPSGSRRSADTYGYPKFRR